MRLKRETAEKLWAWGMKKGPLYAEAMVVGYAKAVEGPWARDGKRILKEMGVRPSREKAYPEEALQRGMAAAYREFLGRGTTQEEGAFLLEAMDKGVPLWAAILLVFASRGYDLTGLEEWLESAVERIEEAGLAPPKRMGALA